MPVTLLQVLVNARTRDSSFTEERATVKSAVPVLSAWQERIVSRIASRTPEAVLEETPIEIALPLADFDAGFEIEESFLRIFEGDVLQGTGENARWVPFQLLHSGARAAYHNRPAGWLRGQTLHLVGRPADWKGATMIRLFWVALRTVLEAPPAGTILEAELQVPDTLTFEDAAAKWLAYNWALRAPKEIGRPSASFLVEAMEAEEELYWHAQERYGVRKGYVREG